VHAEVSVVERIRDRWMIVAPMWTIGRGEGYSFSGSSAPPRGVRSKLATGVEAGRRHPDLYQG
jgi:hypothetical protein